MRAGGSSRGSLPPAHAVRGRGCASNTAWGFASEPSVWPLVAPPPGGGAAPGCTCCWLDTFSLPGLSGFTLNWERHFLTGNRIARPMRHASPPVVKAPPRARPAPAGAPLFRTTHGTAPHPTAPRCAAPHNPDHGFPPGLPTLSLGPARVCASAHVHATSAKLGSGVRSIIPPGAHTARAAPPQLATCAALHLPGFSRAAARRAPPHGARAQRKHLPLLAPPTLSNSLRCERRHSHLHLRFVSAQPGPHSRPCAEAAASWLFTCPCMLEPLPAPKCPQVCRTVFRTL